jgi:nucleoside 2-deoxyribosyltransferase
LKPKVYLAGAIAGLQFDEATDWRHQAHHALDGRGIETLNPMRAKDALASRGNIGHDFRAYQKEGLFFTSRAIMARDFHDVKSCDALLVNLIGCGAARPTYGTVMELGWAYAFQKPAIVIMEPGNPMDNHPMIHETIAFRVETLDEAIDAVAVVLNR